MLWDTNRSTYQPRYLPRIPGQMPAGGDGQRKPNFEPMKINTQMAKEVRGAKFDEV